MPDSRVNAQMVPAKWCFQMLMFLAHAEYSASVQTECAPGWMQCTSSATAELHDAENPRFKATFQPEGLDRFSVDPDEIEQKNCVDA